MKVGAASPNATKCWHSLETLDSFDPTEGNPLSLQVIPYDAFMNLATASNDDFKATLTGWGADEVELPLPPPSVPS